MKARECEGSQDTIHNIKTQHTKLTHMVQNLEQKLRIARCYISLQLTEQVKNLKPLENFVVGNGQWKCCIKTCDKFIIDMLNGEGKIG